MGVSTTPPLLHRPALAKPGLDLIARLFTFFMSGEKTLKHVGTVGFYHSSEYVWRLMLQVRTLWGKHPSSNVGRSRTLRDPLVATEIGRPRQAFA